MKKENPKVLSERLKLREAFIAFLKFLKKAEQKENGIQGIFKMKNKTRKPDTKLKPDQEKPKVNEDKLKKSIAEKEAIIKGNKPVKK